MKKVATQKTGTHKSTATCKDVCFFLSIIYNGGKKHTQDATQVSGPMGAVYTWRKGFLTLRV